MSKMFKRRLKSWLCKNIWMAVAISFALLALGTILCALGGQISEGKKSVLNQGHDQRVSFQTLEKSNTAEPEDTQGARLGEIISILGIATASAGALLFCTISEALKQAIKAKQR
jgi:hypothetical protein